MPYAALVSTFEKIEATTKRLEILAILTQFLLVVARRDTATDTKGSNLLKTVYLCINRVSGSHSFPADSSSAQTTKAPSSESASLCW